MLESISAMMSNNSIGMTNDSEKAFNNVIVDSEILSLSPEPESIIYHFGELRVVRQLQ